MSDEIDDAVRQWLAKANVDWTTVEILNLEARSPREAICFHCQQYTEKLLKALLTLHQIEAPRTHDLRRLIQLASPLADALDAFSDQADRLSQHGVQVRYPDDWREVGEEECVKWCS
jgi:HEPN domain-containing protein